VSQDEILKIIKNYPGIESTELKKKSDMSQGGVSTAVSALVRRGLVHRGPGKNRKTYTLFPV